jgi:predicted GNAT family N-acyltransferase
MYTQTLDAQILSREAHINPELTLSAAANFTGEPVSATGTTVGAKQSLSPKAVTIALAISNGKTRQHIAQMLDESDEEIRAKTSAELTCVVDLDGDQANVLDWLRRYFLEATARPLILISNLLKGPADPIDGFLTRECQKRFAEHALGTIAILQSRERLTDIDRTIVPDVTRDDLVHAMVMLLGRLEYLKAPVPRQVVDPQSMVIRPLRSDNEAEVRSYFQLRHRVYSQMGYLDDITERSLSRLEMNEADVHSIHLGAFCRSGCRELLVGSARVVTNSEADPILVDLFEIIADRAPLAKQRLGEAYQLGLPIFHTYREMTPIIGEIFRKRQKCGELSRVIVDRAFRGNGISNRLISEALERAVGRGVARIFLECLKIHEPLYEKHGFRRMSGFEASVIDVKRTMIAMELQPDVITRIAEKLEYT